MPVSGQMYDHTVLKFIQGLNLASDNFLVNLYSAFGFNAAHTTKAQVDAVATQLTTGNGYTQDTKLLTSVAISLVAPRHCKFTAADVVWTASGGVLGPANFAAVFNTSRTDSPPVFYIDFGGPYSSSPGAPFTLRIHASGIVTFNYNI